jgi:hypothetical protein
VLSLLLLLLLVLLLLLFLLLLSLSITLVGGGAVIFLLRPFGRGAGLRCRSCRTTAFNFSNFFFFSRSSSPNGTIASEVSIGSFLASGESSLARGDVGGDLNPRSLARGDVGGEVGPFFLDRGNVANAVAALTFRGETSSFSILL